MISMIVNDGKVDFTVKGTRLEVMVEIERLVQAGMITEKASDIFIETMNDEKHQVKAGWMKH